MFSTIHYQKNQDDILSKTMKDYFGRNNIKNKIQFQFIFITYSYLSYNFKYLKDKTGQKTNIENSKKINSLSEAIIKQLIKLLN